MRLGEKARFVCCHQMAVGTEKLIKVLREQASSPPTDTPRCVDRPPHGNG